MDIGTVMGTCCAAYHYAIGKPFPLFRDQPQEEKEKWERFVLAAPGVFSEMVNKPVGEVWPRLYLAAHGVPPGMKEPDGSPPLIDPEMPRLERLAWEAVTRHLAMVIDQADKLDMPRLKELEKTWRHWADKRTIKLGVR